MSLFVKHIFYKSILELVKNSGFFERKWKFKNSNKKFEMQKENLKFNSRMS